MKTAKVSSVHYEGRGRRRGVEAGESTKMARMNAKARKSSCRVNAGPVSSVCADRVMTRRMLREALAAEERRVTAMLMERERRYREMLMARERLMEIEKRVVVIQEEEVVPEKRDGEEGKRESETIGEAVVEVAVEDEDKKVDEKAVSGVSEKQEESWVMMARDDWGWNWTCEESQNYWWEGVCYPYWETMYGDHWVV